MNDQEKETMLFYLAGVGIVIFISCVIFCSCRIDYSLKLLENEIDRQKTIEYLPGRMR